MTRGARFRVTSHVSRSLAFAALALVACVASARAASDASGTAAASFLSVGSGASVLSMGGATLATGTDLAAAAWNPASLARVGALQFSLTHAPLPGGATQDWLAAGGRMRAEWSWGTQLLFHREGGIEGRDAANNPTGELSASDVGASAHLARRFGGNVDVGIGAEWVHESLAGTSGSGLAFSGGLRAHSGPFGFAVAARHIGGSMSYAGTRYDLPAVVALGTSYEDPTRGLRVAVDLESPTHYYRSLRLGGEWMWRGQLAVRAGYRSELGNTDAARLSGPTFGMGTGAGSLWMDYAFTPSGSEGAGEHRLGLTFRPAAPNQNRAVGSTEPAKPRTQKPTPATKSAPAHSKAGSAASQPSRPAPVSAPAAAPPVTAVPVPSPETKKPAIESKPESNAEIPVPAPTPVMGQGAGAASVPAPKAVPPASSSTNSAGGAAPATGSNANAPAKSVPAPASSSASAPPATAAAPASGSNSSAPAKPATEKSAPGATATAAPPKDSPAPVKVAPAPAKAASAPAAPRAEASAPVKPAPASEGTALATSKPPVETVVRERPKSVIVGQGETLAMIAKRWDTSVAALMMANDKVNEKVTPGQRLKLPPAAKKGPRIRVTL